MELSDETAQKVLNRSFSTESVKQRYGFWQGKVYEFQPDGRGTWHGYPVKGDKPPPEILKAMLKRGDITNAQYNKLRKGKQ